MSGVKQVVGGSSRSTSGTSSVRLSTPASSTVSTSDDPGASADPQQEGPTVQTGEEILVTQDDCNCEQPKAGGGFVWWPFLGLAAIPFFFIHKKKDCVGECCTGPCRTTTPTPTPTPPVPEPTTLLLFGSGLLALGAGVRRRYKRDRDRSQEIDKIEG
jgi:hypothetical protein